jgi:hypothetical protein
MYIDQIGKKKKKKIKKKEKKKAWVKTVITP